MDDIRIAIGAIALAVVCAVWAIGPIQGDSRRGFKGSPLDGRPPRKGEVDM